MIKKFNQLIDDMPLFIKIIVGAFMCGILVFMCLILFFFIIPEVKADSGKQYLWQWDAVTSSGTYTYDNTSTYRYPSGNLNQVNARYWAFTGNYSGVITLYFTDTNTSIFTNNLIGSIKIKQNNAYTTNPTYNWICIALNKTCTITFKGSSSQSGGYNLQIEIPFNNHISGYGLKVSAVLDWDNSDDLTNTNFTYQTDKQTTSIISNMIENALQSVNQSITNTDSIMESIANLGDDLFTIGGNLIDGIRNSDSTCFHNRYVARTDYLRQGQYINTNGEYVTNSHYNTYGDYPLFAGVTYHLDYENKYNYVNNASYCLYNSSNNLIGCYNISNNLTDFIIEVPESGVIPRYLRFSVPNASEEFLEDGAKAVVWFNHCTNSAGTNAIYGDLNMFQQQRRWMWYDEEEESEKNIFVSIWNKLKNIADNTGNFFSSLVQDPSQTLNQLSNTLSSNNSVSSILLLPVTLLQAFYNGFNEICSDFIIGNLFGFSLKYKCMNLRAIVGDTIWTFYDLVITGVFVLAIRKKMVDIFYKIFSLSMERNELE